MGGGTNMKTLAALRTEAQQRKDSMEKPRLFLAIFPSGPYNGRFLDPYMGIIKINGLDGVFYAGDLDMDNIQAIWADQPSVPEEKEAV
jgi:hypothetical protein